MAKTNYTKVEEALDQNLRKMSIERLFDKANEATKKEKGSDDNKNTATFSKGGESPVSSPLDKTQINLIAALKRDIKSLRQKQHAAIYTKLGIKRSELKEKIDNPTGLTAEEWKEIKEIKAKIDVYKAQLSAQMPDFELSDQVELERHKHINKRFNVNDKWLPLH